MKKELYLLATDKLDGVMPRIFKGILFFLSLIYGLCIRMILFCYKRNIFKSYKLDCKVISIGNITLGGTGKTPLVEFLAKYLNRKGCKVGVLSRGYKRDVNLTQDAGYKYLGDEATMFRLNNPDIPIGVDKNRINKGRELVDKYGLDVVLLDDGFQHWRLKRDLDIVTIDGTRPFGNKYLIPRGILREPLSSLKRAGVFMITKSDADNIDTEEIENRLKNINPHAVFAESVYRPAYFYDINQIELKTRQTRIPSSGIEDKDVCLLCSIANPEYFQRMIINIGLNPALKFYFMDHHEYNKWDLKTLFYSCSKKQITTILTTEKDAVKLKELIVNLGNSTRILVLRIEFEITKNKEGFFERLSSIYNR